MGERVLHRRALLEHGAPWPGLLRPAELALQRFVLGDGHGSPSSRRGLGALGSEGTRATLLRIELDGVALIDVYRVLRARLEIPGSDEPSLDEFLARREFGPVLLLLALQIGEPVLAHVFAQLLAPGGLDASVDDLDVVTKRLSEAPDDKLRMLSSLLSTLRGRRLLGASLRPFRAWIPRVRRFSFEPWVESLPAALPPSGPRAGEARRPWSDSGPH